MRIVEIGVSSFPLFNRFRYVEKRSFLLRLEASPKR